MNIRHDVNQVIVGFVKGEALETFERFYSEHVMINENGIVALQGKAECRKSLRRFFANIQILHSFNAVSALVDGNKAFIEWRVDFTPKGGSRTILKRASVQIWVDKTIIQETLYHQPPIRVPANELNPQHYLFTSTQQSFPHGS
jgi:hypothetical protein